ncbi:MAG: DNA cytosine methyltransferase [Gammaproteobacteria bacterium]|nr:DNA cytosine methyltransferase [Gammaproteobacteria bacterium]
MGKVIPVIDVFAGPGGLGEGFSLYDNSTVKFDIALSIEKDPDAHKTLQLRAFFRQFEENDVPEDYYLYLGGEITLNELYERWPEQAKGAKEEAWLHELKDGDIDKVRKKANSAIKKYDANHWVLIGGPPCQAYSVVGRARMKNHKADFEEDERHFLYQHYLRVVAHLKPSIFIMENVKGILTASVNEESIFEKILDDLEYPGEAVKELDGRKRAPSVVEYDIYSLVVAQITFKDRRGTHIKKLKPRDYIIHAEKFGVPQRRHRVILLGVRKDIDPRVSARLKISEKSTVSDVLDDLPPLRSGITREVDSWFSWNRAIEEIITPPHSEKLDGKTLGVMKQEFLAISSEIDRGGLRVKCDRKIAREFYADWFHDKNLTVALNHQSKSHMKSDLWRYFFSTCYYKAHGKSPLLTDYPKFLLPNHKNATLGNTKFLDRFKVQVGELPASTVTSHISKDGHFFIHHDPSQCRAWSVREAARVQTFPDNYYFEGNRTAQYMQVGNAVPPLLAYQIADVVAQHIAEMK